MSRYGGEGELGSASGTASTAIRLAGALLGLGLAGLGAWCAMVVFLDVYRAVDEPERLRQRLDKFEWALRTKTEAPPGGQREGANGAAGTTAAIAGGAGGAAAAEQMAARVAMTLNASARYSAAFLLVVLLGILLRIAIGLIGAGSVLIQRCLFEREAARLALRELLNRGE